MALSNALVYRGDAEEAVKLAQDAQLVDPYQPDWFHWDLAWALWSSEDCNEAQSELREMVKMPNQARLTKAAIEVCAGDILAAQKTISDFRSEAPEYTISKDREVRSRLYRNALDLDRWSGMLMKAGLPE